MTGFAAGSPQAIKTNAASEIINVCQTIFLKAPSLEERSNPGAEYIGFENRYQLPALPPGTPGRTIGTIVVYPHPCEPCDVAHRVIAISAEDVLTQGDGNSGPDPDIVS